MPFEYVPAGLGATANAAQLIQQRATSTTQKPKVSLISGAKVYGPTTTVKPVAKTPAVTPPKIPVPKAPRPAALPRVPLTPIKTPKVLNPIPRARLTGVLATPAPKPPMVRLRGNQAKQLSQWLTRRFGTPTPKITGLKFEGGAIILPRLWFERFNDARNRVMRMRAKSTAISALAAQESRALGKQSPSGRSQATNKVSQFMTWWRECDIDTWAAWDNAVVSGTGSDRVPTAPFNYWDQRRNVRSVVSPVTGSIAATFGRIKPSDIMGQLAQIPGAVAPSAIGAPGVVQAPPPPPVSQGSGSTTSTSLIDNAPQASSGSSSSTVREMPGSMTMSGLGGLGDAVSSRLAELRARAQQRRAEKSRESSARRAMLVRHTKERAESGGKTVAQRIADARRRRQERQALQTQALAALRRRQQERARDIASTTRGIRSGLAASLQAAAEQRRQNRSVPCPTGVLKVTLFGGIPSGMPAVVAAAPSAPSMSAAEAARRAAKEAAIQKQKLEEHRRRMEQLRAAAEASKATAEMVKDPSIVTGSKDTLIDQEMGKIEDAAAHAEETKIVSDEKEEQVNEIETLLEDAKDQLEEGKAQLADENTLTPEMEALQKQIDELQGALTDAKVEHEESLLASAEASQAQATMMQAEIDRLNALLAAQPQVADVVTEYIDAYEDDLIIANQDIADAEAAVQDAQENVALEAQVASQTSDDIAQTLPFYVRHRNILLLGGAAAVGAGLWWWMRQRSVQPALTANEGYYNLPEPKSPRHPSGL
jgi:hypothetical protein